VGRKRPEWQVTILIFPTCRSNLRGQVMRMDHCAERAPWIYTHVCAYPTLHQHCQITTFHTSDSISRWSERHVPKHTHLHTDEQEPVALLTVMWKCQCTQKRICSSHTDCIYPDRFLSHQATSALSSGHIQ